MFACSAIKQLSTRSTSRSIYTHTPSKWESPFTWPKPRIVERGTKDRLVKCWGINEANNVTNYHSPQTRARQNTLESVGCRWIGIATTIKEGGDHRIDSLTNGRPNVLAHRSVMFITTFHGTINSDKNALNIVNLTGSCQKRGQSIRKKRIIFEYFAFFYSKNSINFS